MTNRPFFSIIIPVVAINNYVRETVSVLQSLTGPDWELFVNTNLPEENPWSHDPRINLIHSGQVGPADKRDQASRLAHGEYLVFLDDDSYPNDDYLEVARKAVAETGADLIGGPGVTPPTDALMQQVSGAVFSSKLTGGNPERYLSIGSQHAIDDWPSVNMIVRKSTFLSVNGFDSPYWPGEDTFLCAKLNRINASMVYFPTLIVWHHRRSGFFRHLKQVGAYGLHRGYFAKRYPTNSLKLKYFAPSILTVSFLILPILSVLFPPFVPWAITFVLLYLATISASMLTTVPHHGWLVALLAVPFVIATHLSYGVQFLKGLFLSKSLSSRLRN